MLEIDGAIVRVRHLGIRSTVVVSRDDEELIVPNSNLVQSTVKNFTLSETLFRLRTQVGVAYSSDMTKVKEVLEKAAAAVPWREPTRDPVVLLTGFGDSAVNFDISVWTHDPWQSPRQRSQLNFAVWDALKRAGITIAFPQLDVHVEMRRDQAL